MHCNSEAGGCTGLKNEQDAIRLLDVRVDNPQVAAGGDVALLCLQNGAPCIACMPVTSSCWSHTMRCNQVSAEMVIIQGRLQALQIVR